MARNKTSIMTRLFLVLVLFMVSATYGEQNSRPAELLEPAIHKPEEQAIIESMQQGEGDDENILRADTLFEEGLDFLFNQQDYEAALSSFSDAYTLYFDRGEFERAADALTGVGLALFYLEKYEDALQAQHEALALAQKAGASSVEADALSNITEICSGFGAPVACRASLEQVRDRYLEMLTIVRAEGTQEQEWKLLYYLGGIYNKLGQYKLGLDTYQQARTIAKNISNPELESYTLQAIAIDFVYEQGRYQPALDYLQQVLVIEQELNNEDTVRWALTNIGIVHLNLGQFEDALKSFEDALVIAKKNNDVESMYDILHKTSFVYYNMNQDDIAMDYAQRALEITKKIEKPRATAVVLNTVGMYYFSEDNKKALEAFQQALAIQKEHNAQTEIGSTLNNIGHIYKDLGDYEKALDYFQQALKNARANRDPFAESVALSAIGTVHFDLKEYELAADYYQQALNGASRAGNPDIESSILADLGDIQAEQGNISSAIDFYKQAVDLVESIQGDIKTKELKTSFISKNTAIYTDLINLLWTEGAYKEAFNYVERAKARAFLDQLAQGTINFRAGVSSALLEQEEELKNEMATVRGELRTLYGRPRAERDTEAIAAAEDELDRLQGVYNMLLINIRRNSPETAALLSVDVASLVEVQKLLDPNIALVEYYVTEERTLVFIITQQSFEHDEIAVNRDNLLQYIQTARVPSEQSHPEVLQTLYRWLFAESVAEYFDTDIQAIGFVPHDLLHYLPFAALSDGEKHLIDNYALFTLPSVSVLRYLPEKRKSTIETVLALGNPDVTRPGLTKLEFAAQEAIHVGNLYNTQAFINADATESIFWSKASDAGIVHLAAHGIYNRYNPLFSTIYLTGNDEGDSHGDGQLQVHEIYGLDLRSHTDLVVLSACDSAVGDLSSGDEIVSLNRALLYAGTPTVLASLWKVDDKPTYLLMKHFHDNLKGGMSKATALRLAQQEVRKDYPSPYYWAGFVLTGDGGNIEAGPTSNTEQDDSLGTATDTPDSALLTESSPNINVSKLPSLSPLLIGGLFLILTLSGIWILRRRT